MIRLARRADAGAIHAMMSELAEFEGGTVKSTEADLARDGFGERPLFEVLLAEDECAAILGMLVFFPIYSTWEGRPGLMIHDLFVRPSGRGRGLGKALVRALARLAVERECTRIDVNVIDWNDKARDFYHSCGLVLDQGWLRHRAGGDVIAALARQEG